MAYKIKQGYVEENRVSLSNLGPRDSFTYNSNDYVCVENLMNIENEGSIICFNITECYVETLDPSTMIRETVMDITIRRKE